MKRLKTIVPPARIMEMASRRLKPNEHRLVFEETHGVIDIPTPGSFMDTSNLTQENRYRDQPMSKKVVVMGVLGCCIGAGVGLLSKSVILGVGAATTLGVTPFVVDALLSLSTRVRVLSWEKEMLQRSAVIIHGLREKAHQQMLDRYNHLRNHSAPWFLKEHDARFTQGETTSPSEFYHVSQNKH